jgi:hypothetical protein
VSAAEILAAVWLAAAAVLIAIGALGVWWARQELDEREARVEAQSAAAYRLHSELVRREYAIAHPNGYTRRRAAAARADVPTAPMHAPTVPRMQMPRAGQR